MKLKCPHCKKIIERDMRLRVNKNFIKKRGYESYCDEKQRRAFLKLQQ